MVTIETIATVTEDGMITARAAGPLPQGQYHAVIVLEGPLKVAEGLAPSGWVEGAEARRRLGAPSSRPLWAQARSPSGTRFKRPEAAFWAQEVEDLRAFRPPRRGQAPPLLWVNACTQVNA